MTIPYCLLMIKPMSVGRGDAPKILEELLTNLPITLRFFRSWLVCNTTLAALCDVTDLHYENEKVHLSRGTESWIGVFTHTDRTTDPTELIQDYCGPSDPLLCKSSHLRYKYGGYSLIGKTAHPSDTVVHISTPDNVELQSDLLMRDFDKEKI